MKYELPEEIDLPMENSYLSLGSDGCKIVFADRAACIAKKIPHAVVKEIQIPRWAFSFFEHHANLCVADALRKLQKPFEEACRNISAAMAKVEKEKP